MPTITRRLRPLFFVSGGLVCHLGLTPRHNPMLIRVLQYVVFVVVSWFFMSRHLRAMAPAKGGGAGLQAEASGGVWDDQIDAPT